MIYVPINPRFKCSVVERIDMSCFVGVSRIVSLVVLS